MVRRSAPKTGKERPTLRVHKTSAGGSRDSSPGGDDGEGGGRDEADTPHPPTSQTGAGARPGTHLAVRLCMSCNPGLLKAWAGGGEKIDLGPGLTGRGQGWLQCLWASLLGRFIGS